MIIVRFISHKWTNFMFFSQLFAVSFVFVWIYYCDFLYYKDEEVWYVIQAKASFLWLVCYLSLRMDLLLCFLYNKDEEVWYVIQAKASFLWLVCYFILRMDLLLWFLYNKDEEVWYVNQATASFLWLVCYFTVTTTKAFSIDTCVCKCITMMLK